MTAVQREPAFSTPPLWLKILRRALAEVPVTHLERTARRAYLRARKRPLDPDFRIFAKLALPTNGQVLDVGANHGFAIDAIRMAKPAAEIIAFEPNPDAADYLERAFAGEVQVYRCALGARAGLATLHVPRYRRRVLDGLASLQRDAATGWLHGRTLGSGDVRLSAVDVPVRTLDEFRLRPCLIKIDVQGTETAVVRGGIETIKRHMPVIFVEDQDAELEGLMASLGYTRQGLWRGNLASSEAKTKNVLFLPAGCAVG